MAIMMYHITLWKDIKDNKESKPDTMKIFKFVQDTDFGILKLQLEAEQGQGYTPEQLRQYQEQAQQQAESET